MPVMVGVENIMKYSYLDKTHCTRDLHTAEERTPFQITVELIFTMLRNNRSVTIQLMSVRVGVENIEKILYLVKTRCTRDVHTAEERMPLKITVAVEL